MTVPDRLPALVAVLVLAAALVVTALVTTPWNPLGGPVPGGRVSAEAARDFTPAQLAKEDAYHGAVRPPAYASLAIGLVVLGLLALTPLGGRLVSAVARPLGGGWAWQVLLGVLAVALVVRLVTLPFDARAEQVRRTYGLSTQTWGTWAVDVAKGFVVGTALTLVAVLALVALARALPHRWWVPASLGAAVLVVAVSFAYPLVIEPVFNRFTPMSPGPLRTSLVQMAHEDGLAVDEVLVADASRRTSALNAYVSGFGSSRRIVVYDTLLEDATPDQVRLVVAHELGHAKRNDVLFGTALGALGAALAVTLLYLALTSSGLLRRGGADGAGDPRVIPLVLFLAMAIGLLASPAESLVSRRIEARADVHALDLTGEVDTFASMQRRLALTNLSDLDPNPVVYAWFATHPTAPERIALDRSWARQHGRTPPANLAP